MKAKTRLKTKGPHESAAAFRPGAMVLVTLGNPREKFWGVLRDLSLAGLSVCGIDLNSFTDFASMVKSGEPHTACEVFFPMHRVERIEIDASNGHALSLAERFHRTTGHTAAAVLGTRQKPARELSR